MPQIVHRFARRAGLVALAFTVSAFALPPPAKAADPASPDWPCVWRKVLELDAATIWDGPALDDAAKSWRNDDAVRKLSDVLISRRLKLEEVEAAIAKFAEAQAADVRDKKLTELFAGVLARTNEDRKTVMAGIERFHKRQLARAKEIEARGITLPEAGQPLPEKPMPAGEIDKVSDEQDKLNWDIRVFQERQQNIPLACEIPQLMDERAGAVARAIRGLMKS